MDPKTLAIIVLGGVVAAGVVGWLFRKDTALEETQRGLVKLTAFLEKWGFNRLSEITTNLAIKDASGAISETALLVRLMNDPEQALSILDENFYHQLKIRLERENDWPKIQKAYQARLAADRAEKGRALAALRKVPQDVPIDPADDPVA